MQESYLDFPDRRTECPDRKQIFSNHFNFVIASLSHKKYPHDSTPSPVAVMPTFQTFLFHRYNKSKNPQNLTLKTPLELKTLQVLAVVHLNLRSSVVAVFVLFLNQTYKKNHVTSTESIIQN